MTTNTARHRILAMLYRIDDALLPIDVFQSVAVMDSEASDLIT